LRDSRLLGAGVIVLPLEVIAEFIFVDDALVSPLFDVISVRALVAKAECIGAALLVQAEPILVSKRAEQKTVDGVRKLGDGKGFQL
jgi:hypothetical protein